MRIGVMLPVGPRSITQAVEAAVVAEQAGFSSAWLANVGIDALTVLALAGKETERIELGTAVVPTYPRHPVMLAQQAATVQAAIGGRLALGIGLSHRVAIEDGLGLDYSRPIPHTREYLTILNGLLEGQRVEFKGELYRVNSAINTYGAPKPPILVAALGPDMLRLCGRLADGTLTWMGGLSYLRDFAVPRISAAAQKAGRPAPRIVAALPICVTQDIAGAREYAEQIYANYGRLPSYRGALDHGGASGPGDIVVVGSEHEIERQLHEFAQAGVTDFVASLFRAPGASDHGTYELLSALARRAEVPAQ